MGEDRPTTGRRLTVDQAATTLGISADAVRSRIKRRTLKVEREAGRVWVLVDSDRPTTGHDQPTDRPSESNALISEMRGRIRFLEEELQRKDAILLSMTEAMKALSPPAQGEPPEAPEAPETATEQVSREAPFTEEQTPTSRRWWEFWR